MRTFLKMRPILFLKMRSIFLARRENPKREADFLVTPPSVWGHSAEGPVAEQYLLERAFSLFRFSLRQRLKGLKNAI